MFFIIQINAFYIFLRTTDCFILLSNQRRFFISPPITLFFVSSLTIAVISSPQSPLLFISLLLVKIFGNFILYQMFRMLKMCTHNLVLCIFDEARDKSIYFIFWVLVSKRSRVRIHSKELKLCPDYNYRCCIFGKTINSNNLQKEWYWEMTLWG